MEVHKKKKLFAGIILLLISGCSTVIKEKKVNAVTLIKNGNSITVIANESFYRGEILMEGELNSSDIKAGENIPEISVEIKEGKTNICFITYKDEIVAGQELFTIENYKKNVKINSVVVINKLETVNNTKRE